MREIKFRAWYKKGKVLQYWGDFEEIALMFNIHDFHKIISGYELMQFTGLLDKHGKEIYEGDIVKIDQEGRKMFDAVDSDGSGVREYQVVAFKDGAWMTTRNALAPLFMGHEDTYLWVIKTSSEIIGNIYENPNLLQESKGRE